MLKAQQEKYEQLKRKDDKVSTYFKTISENLKISNDTKLIVNSFLEAFDIHTAQIHAQIQNKLSFWQQTNQEPKISFL